MFGSLEEQSDELKLNGYGIGITSLEEVFMKVGAENANDGSRKQASAIMNGGSGYPDDDVESITCKFFLPTLYIHIHIYNINFQLKVCLPKTPTY